MGQFGPKLGMGELMAEEKTWLWRIVYEDKKWSGRRFAQEIGYSYSQAHRFLTGEQPPSGEACKRIAAVLGGGITEEDVMREAGRLSPLPPDYDKAQEKKLVELLQGLSYPDRKQLVEFAQFLLGRDVGNDGENGGDEGDEGN